MRIRSQAQKGYSMIELLIVLAIIAALIAGVFYLYPRVQAARSANAEAAILQSVQASVKSLYTTGQYSSLTTAVSAQAGMWPDAMLNSVTAPTTLTNEWGGLTLVSGATVAATAATACTTAPCRAFMVTYPAVPSAVCQKLLPALASSWDFVSVGTNVVINAGAATPVQYSPAVVPVACGPTGGAPVQIVMASR